VFSIYKKEPHAKDVRFAANLVIFIHSDAPHHAADTPGFVGEKAAYTVGYDHGTCCRKAKDGERQIRMSHYMTFFTL
jgi:hypothetical protein